MSNKAKLTGSDLVARSLRLEGVENLFVLAGDHVLPVLDVMSDEGFRLIDTRHEQAAAHMADAWGLITGQPGVAMYTTPGFANAIPALANAYHSESPMLSISGSAELLELGRGAMQEIDQIGMAKPVTKGAWLITDPHHIPDMLKKAFRTALEGRRGPVHLTIPIDVQEAAIEESRLQPERPEEYRTASLRPADPEVVSAIVDMLHSAERPMIVAGNGAHSVSPKT